MVYSQMDDSLPSPSRVLWFFVWESMHWSIAMSGWLCRWTIARSFVAESWIRDFYLRSTRMNNELGYVIFRDLPTRRNSFVLYYFAICSLILFSFKSYREHKENNLFSMIFRSVFNGNSNSPVFNLVG